MTNRQVPHHFDAGAIAWTEDARFPGIAFKILESRATHPAISVVQARVEVGRTIQTHVHPIETETFYVLAGVGKLRVKIGEEDAEKIFTTGQGGSIPPGLYHSLENVGDVPLQLLAMHSPPTR